MSDANRMANSAGLDPLEAVRSEPTLFAPADLHKNLDKL